MFLSEEQIREMTGRVQHNAQAKMLRSLGIIFKTRADGTILVLRDHVEKELGGKIETKRKPKEFQPNWKEANA
jgi:hypothetical protein